MQQSPEKGEEIMRSNAKTRFGLACADLDTLTPVRREHGLYYQLTTFYRLSDVQELSARLKDDPALSKVHSTPKKCRKKNGGTITQIQAVKQLKKLHLPETELEKLRPREIKRKPTKRDPDRQVLVFNQVDFTALVNNIYDGMSDVISFTPSPQASSPSSVPALKNRWPTHVSSHPGSSSPSSASASAMRTAPVRFLPSQSASSSSAPVYKGRQGTARSLPLASTSRFPSIKTTEVIDLTLEDHESSYQRARQLPRQQRSSKADIEETILISDDDEVIVVSE
ncbi:hypothetical protein F5146DRAFT_1016384 [Armillaria mellea]|nr:hypothetical protein F5146DRAFT_1016338 [Armillaria mellea]KAK0197702.1 hypothetical protein F5146DRAFT_1016384 [Armillaria mellea]